MGARPVEDRKGVDRGIDMPPSQVNATYEKGPKAKDDDGATQLALDE